MILGRPEEPPVLSKCSVSGLVWLIGGFRLRNSITAWLIVALVNKSGSTILESILVRRARPDGHEQHGVIVPQPEVHPALEARALPSAHFQIGDDFVGHECRALYPRGVDTLVSRLGLLEVRAVKIVTLSKRPYTPVRVGA
jgi:hypothetical protein